MEFGVEEGFSEFDYLSASNMGRGRYYRIILRIMYNELDRREYLFSHEIVRKIREIDRTYDEKTCNEDLEVLCKKGNIIKYKNDYSQIKTLEELRKKRYRYQITKTGRLIEEFVIRRLDIENSLSTTLDPNLLIRFKKELREVAKVDESEKLHSRWNNILHAFELLRGNYQGYLQELNNFQQEVLLEESDFLVRKEKLSYYLKDFIGVLMREGREIREILEEFEGQGEIKRVLDTVIKEEFDKAKLTKDSDFKVIKDRYNKLYQGIRNWFIAREDDISELEYLSDSTRKIIGKLTKLAKHYIEEKQVNYSREDSYLRIATEIYKINELDKVKEVSSIIFGDYDTYHLKSDYSAEEEVVSIEDSAEITILMKPLKARKKEKADYGIKDRTLEKKESLLQEEKRRRDEVLSLKNYLHEDTLILDRLPRITKGIKKIIIALIKTGLTKVYSEERIETREDKLYYMYGRARYNSFSFHLFRPVDEDDRVVLDTFDGKLNTPNFRLEFIKEKL